MKFTRYLIIARRFLTIFLSVLLIMALFSPATFAGDKDRPLLLIDNWITSSVDPTQDWSSWNLRVIDAGEKLLDITPDGHVAPRLAESIENLDDHTWEVKLRPGVKFWSGAPMDAQAVKDSFERTRQLDPAGSPLFKGTTIDVVAPLTLHFKTEAVDGFFPLVLANEQLCIHNAKALGPKPAPSALESLDLTGPYKIKSWTSQGVELEAWDGYWGRSPSIKHLQFKVITDNSARVLAAQSGEADIVRLIPPDGIPTMQKAKNVNLFPTPASNVCSVYLNLDTPVFKDVKVRQALSWAIDRQTLDKVANLGYGRPLPSWFANNPMYPEAAQQGQTRCDLELAGRLLDEAGWRLNANGLREKDGRPLEFTLMTWGTEKLIGPVLQAQWAKLGVKCNVLHSDDFAMIQAKRDQGDWDAVIEGWTIFGSPLAMFRSHFGPDGDVNYSKFSDPEINRIVEAMARTVDQRELHQLVLEGNQRASEVLPFIPLVPRLLISAVTKDLNGFQPHFMSEYCVTTDLEFK